MATQHQTEPGIVRVPPGTWHVDPAHSSVEFEIKHMMIATVRGRFRGFEGTPTAPGDFFDGGGYPEIRFESTRVEALGGSRFRILGDLTIKDTTREIELEA